MFYSMLQKLYYKFLAIKSERYFQRLLDRGLTIGEDCILPDRGSIFWDPSHCYLISIGNQCAIAPNVRFIAHDGSTFPYLGYTKYARIEVKDNCMIGDSAMILPGVTIGPKAIVAAGAVVSKDVRPNTVVAGNPAKEIAQLDEYLAKIEAIRKKKKVFDQSYYIENLTEAKKKELLEAIGSDFGLIL